VDDKTYEDRVIKITDLVGDDGLLDGFTFIGCHIKGPAVIWLAGSALSNNVLSDTADAVLWDILPGGAAFLKGGTREPAGGGVGTAVGGPIPTGGRGHSAGRSRPWWPG
jgi:hypothetical protein